MRRALRRRGARFTMAAGLLALAAAAILALVILGGGRGSLQKAELARGLGGARAILVRGGGRAELRLSGMPQPPIGEVYEVWLSGAHGEPRATNALFTVTSAGTAGVEVPGSLRGVARITVTAEPLGGSPRPTSEVILSVAPRHKGGA
jgi:Anti-sigma-K factor rskA